MFNDLIAKVIYQAYKPRPRISLSECADRHRYILTAETAHPGKWKTSSVEYTRGIMDAISDLRYQIVVIRKPAQVGGTEIILNAILYFMAQDPSSILWVLPTLEMATKYSKKRLSTMIKDCKVLHSLFSDDFGKKKKSDDTILNKIFTGGEIGLVGSNSESGVSGEPKRCIFFDEVDKYEGTSGGDTIKLGLKRNTTYEDSRKAVITSTPSVSGLSEIDKWYDRSDRRIYEVPCAICGHWQVLKWKNITGFKIATGEYDPGRSFYECPHCNSPLNDRQINSMVKNGRWKITGKYTGIAGFDIGIEIISPWVKMSETVAAFLDAKNNPEYLREWVNLSLGESHNDANVELNGDKLQARAEDYEAVVPNGAGCLICSVDTQDDRLEALLVAFGELEEAWIIEHQIFLGDPSIVDPHDPVNPWTVLGQYIEKEFPHESGSMIPIHTTVIDAMGHQTDQVYRFVKPRQVRNVWALKGIPGNGPIISKRPHKSNKGRVDLFHVSGFSAKEIIYSRLLRNEPGPGYFHFTKRLDAEFFAQVASEKKVVRRDKQRRVIRKFVPIRARNEALDLLVYALAGLRILNPDLERMAKLYSSGQKINAKTGQKTIRRVRSRVEH